MVTTIVSDRGHRFKMCETYDTSSGEPTDVLLMEETTLPAPSPNRIRVRVIACGVNPTDWALCWGLFAGNLPRGIGLEVSGTVPNSPLRIVAIW